MRPHAHGHDHAHEHGHSHRAGAATQYWRDPRANAVTVVLFLAMVLWVVSRPSPVSDGQAQLAKDRGAVVAWIDLKHFAVPASVVDVGMPVRAVALPSPSAWCSATPDLVACGTASCVAAFASRADVVLVVESAAAAEFASVNATVRLSGAAVKGKVDWARELKRAADRSSRPAFARELCAPSGAFARFARVAASPECADVRPGDARCDAALCPEGFAAYRSDLGGCVTDGACSLPTFSSCLDADYSHTCALECAAASFGKHVAVERLVRATMAVANGTLFFLGGLLALIFARVNWVNPLLAKYEGVGHD